MDRLELLLHPIRMQIVITLANRVLSAQKLAELLPDIAQTTLYRHINLLLDGGVLRVVRESRVRGAVERELTLAEDAGRIDLETSSGLRPEQHEQIFTTVVATLLADFKRSQQQARDGIPPAFYSRQRLYLTPREVEALNRQLTTLLSAYRSPARKPDEGDIAPWTFTGIVMPDTELPVSKEEQADETDI